MAKWQTFEMETTQDAAGITRQTERMRVHDGWIVQVTYWRDKLPILSTSVFVPDGCGNWAVEDHKL